MQTADLLETLRKLEVALHQPALRSDPVALGELLHPSFREFGRSGRIYTRDDVLGEFTGAPPAYEVWSQDFHAEEVSPGVVLVTYRSAHVGPAGVLSHHTNRASLWQLTPSGWKMRFHQGTPTGEFEKHAS